MTVERDLPLATATKKDKAALVLGQRLGIKHVALSFASSGRDIDEIRALSHPDVFVISKIESRAALNNLDDILNRSDAVLIDRGDLSRQEPLERIPYLPEGNPQASNWARQAGLRSDESPGVDGHVVAPDTRRGERHN